MTTFPYPPSVRLAHLPTPLLALEHASRYLGVQLLCKRDDLTGSALSGNKVRKLDFLLAAALESKCGGVITCGGAQSNHARATALAAARMGLTSHLLLRTADPLVPPACTGNILLDRMAGASIQWITAGQYAYRDDLMANEAARLRRELGHDYYVIPEGGSNALGACGYIRCAEELASQLGRGEATVVFAVGSGGTAAGLIAGCRLLNLPYRLIGICVADDGQTFRRRIAAILHDMSNTFGANVVVDEKEIELWDDYVGRGYALSRDEELSCIIDIAQMEGLILDPVYTGKAMYGLVTELRRGRRLPGPIVFLHTGGIYGLLGQSEQMTHAAEIHAARSPVGR